jgi:hypothetical protein
MSINKAASYVGFEHTFRMTGAGNSNPLDASANKTNPLDGVSFVRSTGTPQTFSADMLKDSRADAIGPHMIKKPKLY